MTGVAGEVGDVTPCELYRGRSASHNIGGSLRQYTAALRPDMAGNAFLLATADGLGVILIGAALALPAAALRFGVLKRPRGLTWAIGAFLVLALLIYPTMFWLAGFHPSALPGGGIEWPLGAFLSFFALRSRTKLSHSAIVSKLREIAADESEPPETRAKALEQLDRLNARGAVGSGVEGPTKSGYQ